MENPCRIVCFGDSITLGYTPLFEGRLKKGYPDYQIEVVNAGVASETTRHGLTRLEQILALKPTVCLVGFGMNDWRKDVPPDEFGQNLRRIVDALQAQNVRVLLLTINPDWQDGATSKLIDDYNAVILAVVAEKRIRVVEVNALWKREINPIHAGLSDALHPNERGYEIILTALMRMVPRVSTTVVWQYNGYYAACNYACPYCYYPTKRHYFRHTIEQWREGFLHTFGKQRVTFYLSYGEPTLGRNFYEVLDMIASEPQWDAMMTTNLSQPLTRLFQTSLVTSGRLNINTSFHPTQNVTAEQFLHQLLALREHGIEPSIVYVMYPEQIADFPFHFRLFDRHGFFVHVRRFRGLHKGWQYPEAYTEQERRMVARYMDGVSLRMMLSNRSSFHRLSYAGLFYIVVNNDGDVGASPEFPDYGKRGNIVAKTSVLHMEPQPYRGAISEGSVDGVATLLDLNLRELSANHVWTFASQGGVHRRDGKIQYPFVNTDFGDPRVRRELNFGPPVAEPTDFLRHPLRSLENALAR